MKKIITTIFITVLVAVLAAAPMSGCSSECEHSVSSWTVVQAATCSTPGIKEGRCGICYELVQEEIPADGVSHVYAGWEVAAPTTTKEGVAVETCTECGHYERVTLPTLDNIEYTSKITVRPSATQSGVSQYTYPSEYGDITFEVEIGSEGIQTVSDAVSVGSMDESHNMIRTVTGTRGDYKVTSGSIDDSVLAAVESSAKSFSYELYEEYTHITADDKSQYWMGLDDGEIYGYRLDEKKNFDIITNTNYFYGFRYYFTYSDALSEYYGTENFLSSIYAYAKTNMNGDFKESINSDGSYSFSFGTYTVYRSGLGGALFSKIEVNFTLTETYTIDTFSYYSVTYENDSETFDSSTGTWGSDATFNFNSDGNAYVTTEYGTKYIESYTVTQTERQSGETEQTSPYTPETRFYTDFDVTYNGAAVNYVTTAADGTEVMPAAIELVAGAASGYVFEVTDLIPSNIVGDTITFYYRNYTSADEYEYVEINYGTEASEGIFVHLNSSNKFTIKGNVSGEIVIAVSTTKVMKEFVIDFTVNSPTALYPTVYNYSSSTGYVAETSSGSTGTATVYAGQPLYFKTSLSASEEGICTETFTTAVSGTGINTSDYSVSDSIALEVANSGDYASVSSFTAYKAGTYVLTLTSTEDSSVTCTITVTVTEAPSLDTILTGSYSGTFSLGGEEVSVSFGEITKEKVVYTNDGGSSVTVYKCTVTATVSYDGDTEVLITYYTSEDGTQVLSSSYAQVYGAEDMITSSMSEDVKPKYYFTITLNEAFDLVISHTSDYDSQVEDAVLR